MDLFCRGIGLFHELSIFGNYDSMLTQTSIICTTLIDIAHRMTYINWLWPQQLTW